jgi:hypothetical protein
MLEPYDGKLSRTVLRGAWGRKTLGPTRCITIVVLKYVLNRHAKYSCDLECE